MGWRFKWVSSNRSDFNSDYHVSFTKDDLAKGPTYYNFEKRSSPSEGEAPGLSVFYKDATGGIFHTYSAYARGLEVLDGAYHFIDLAPKGRDEEGLPFPGAWWRHHDRYAADTIQVTRGVTMRYLCLICYDEKKHAALSRDEAEALAAEARDYVEELRRGGHYVASDALQSVRTATTLRTGNGRLTTTDEPFAETKEQLGGFILIEARDLNDAIRLAAKIPPARLGCVEVRPVKEQGCASQDGGN